LAVVTVSPVGFFQRNVTGQGNGFDQEAFPLGIPITPPVFLIISQKPKF
jgi:hypothetical protein